MSELERQDRTIREADLVRRYALRIGLKAFCIATADFVLLAILAPNLVNRHQDMALAVALACVAVAFGATIWLGFQLWYDLRQFADARRQLRRDPILKVIRK